MIGVHEQLANLPDYLGGHIRLVLMALIIGISVGIPLGIFVTRYSKFEKIVLGIAGVIQTIPGLALLAVMVPLLNMIGIIPALIALTLYSLLPILRNTVVGIYEIDEDIIEAGYGTGMTDNQLLRFVQLPLALPVIIAGIRTSAVWVIGIATLSTPVGATSLGNYIFSGLQTRNNISIIFGCVFAALLAIVIDNIIHGFEIGLRKSNTKRMIGSAVGSLAIIVLGLTLGVSELWGGSSKQTTIEIGGKPFTEQYILTHMLSHVVDSMDGFNSEIVTNLGSTVAFDALKENQIDLYVDYSGTLWNMYLSQKDIPASSDSVLNYLGRYLLANHNVHIIAQLGFENAYCLAVHRKLANRLNLESITDLSQYNDELVIGGDIEFFGRPEWNTLITEYELQFDSRRTMDAVLMYSAVREGQVDVITAYTTDGRINAYNLQILDDPKNVFPPYDAVILLSPDAVDSIDLVNRIKQLNNALDNELMRSMNMRVDIQKESPATVGKLLYNKLRSKLGTNYTIN